MKINKRKYQQLVQRLLSKNLIAFPFFLIISIILYSFVVVKNNAPANKFNNPDGKDSLNNNLPKIDIKVNKKYDDKGNLIQYDSSYSIVYSSPDVNTNINFFKFDNDSIFKQFKGNMNEYPLFNDDFFKDFQSFGFDQNFFQLNPMNNIRQMEEMMNKMRKFYNTDSVTINSPQNVQPQVQPQAQPKLQNTTPNMITL